MALYVKDTEVDCLAEEVRTAYGLRKVCRRSVALCRPDFAHTDLA
jgi:hypothetical protein